MTETLEQKQIQHTPGPWHKHSDGEKTYASVRSAKGQIVADCGARSDQIAQANARLIAAAPALLAALRAVLPYAEAWIVQRHDAKGNEVRDAARAAIAAATGEGA